jgi:2-iminoacetate synthase ThiH
MSIFSNVRVFADSHRTWLTRVENHINGENLMEMDQTQLKEMGIKKVGDRVRIGSQAKQLRNKEYKKVSRRVSNRVRISPSHICSTH